MRMNSTLRAQNGSATKRQTDSSVATLTAEELHILESCESIIQQHLAEFFKVGVALATVQEGRLYRLNFKTFEHYCAEKWGFGRSQAYRLVDAAKVQKLLSPLGDNVPLPTTERQIRPLAGLPPKVAEKAWKIAVERSEHGAPTGELVAAVVKEVYKPSRSQRESQSLEMWQQQVIPLLKEALAKAKSGEQEAVEDLLNKAVLRANIGQCHSLHVVEDI